MLIKVAINGSRTLEENPSVPVTPQQQAVESAAAVAAGAGAIHLHVRGADGTESLSPDSVARALEAIRAACPGVPVGVSTGSWIAPNAQERLGLIQAWEVLPDFASVNVHEEGALRVINLLIGKGVGVEAGVWNARAAKSLVSSGLVGECLRILIEPGEEPGDAGVNLAEIETALGSTSLPRLLHGLDGSAWQMIGLAAQRGYDTRIGFEDTLTLPDGTYAESNAVLVHAAFSILERAV
ncbi:MAG: 3-keto-5-aminohexanoate cleavage protein [Pyrinomonadaceae bacterium]